MKVLAFGASSSQSSINKQFASYVAHKFSSSEVRILDLNDYEMPIYSVDKEKQNGFHPLAIDFVNQLEWADIIIISFAEHNGSYSSAFKNIFDWASRYKLKMFEGKKLILLSTSLGLRGGQSVLETAVDRMPRHGAEVIASFSLPQFKENFNPEIGITHEELRQNLNAVLKERS